MNLSTLPKEWIGRTNMPQATIDIINIGHATAADRRGGKRVFAATPYK